MIIGFYYARWFLAAPRIETSFLALFAIKRNWRCCSSWHRPVLALLVHTVPTLDVWRRSARWEGGAAITAARLSETLSVDARCPERRDIGNTPSPRTATTSRCP